MSTSNNGQPVSDTAIVEPTDTHPVAADDVDNRLAQIGEILDGVAERQRRLESLLADPSRLPPKAQADDFAGRFREIVSDPLNLLIERVPLAGVVENGAVWLHNGNRVPLAGPGAYFGDFSQILVINRGVHEPLEEFIFQTLLRTLPEAPTMLELGAYWAHYSMWLKRARPMANAIMVEPLPEHLQAGTENFARNGFAGEFIGQFVGPGQFEVDAFLASRPGLRLDVLHADIDRNEVTMLAGARSSLANHRIGRLFISTHSQQLHAETAAILRAADYRIEVSSDFDGESTSFDGFLFASSPDVPPLFPSRKGGFGCLGRLEITAAGPRALLERLQQIVSLQDAK